MPDEKRKLLVVEDDRGLQKQLKWALSGYEVIAAKNRQQAIAELRRHEPPVVLQDLGLPHDAAGVEEGFATLREILSIAPRTKVIVVTGNGDRDNAVRAVGRPCWPGLILVAGAAIGWLLARAADVGIGQEILLPVLLWSATLTVFGSAAARTLAFPLGFLYFVIPIWDFVNPLLQAATTAVVGVLLAVTL